MNDNQVEVSNNVDNDTQVEDILSFLDGKRVISSFSYDWLSEEEKASRGYVVFDEMTDEQKRAYSKRSADRRAKWRERKEKASQTARETAEKERQIFDTRIKEFPTELLKQTEVRERYKKRLVREKQSYISSVTGIPCSLLSQFKQGKRDLWNVSLYILNAYLDGKLEVEDID